MTEGRKCIGSAGELALLMGGVVEGAAAVPLCGLATLEQAGPGDVTFIRDGRNAARWAECQATAALVPHGLVVPGHDPLRRALIRVSDADLAMIILLERAAALLAPPPPSAGVHATALVDPGASVAGSASVGPFCMIAAGAVIGERTVLHGRVTLGPGVRVGAGCEIHAGVVLQSGTRIGSGCIIHPGVVIGADGFGYRPAADGRGVVKVPHIGGVLVGDAVEIGANSTIDRGKLGDTVIGAGTKIDNLVQIGHNCRIGRGVLICGASAIGGSTEVGDGVLVGGKVGIPDNVVIEAGARIAGGSLVAGNIAGGETVAGVPARPAAQAMRDIANVRALGKLKARVAELEARLGSPRVDEAEEG